MFRFLRLFLTCCLLAFLISPCAYVMAQEEGEYARSTFFFAERKQWNEALISSENSNDEALIEILKENNERLYPAIMLFLDNFDGSIFWIRSQVQVFLK